MMLNFLILIFYKIALYIRFKLKIQLLPYKNLLKAQDLKLLYVELFGKKTHMEYHLSSPVKKDSVNKNKLRTKDSLPK